MSACDYANGPFPVIKFFKIVSKDQTLVSLILSSKNFVLEMWLQSSGHSNFFRGFHAIFSNDMSQ